MTFAKFFCGCCCGGCGVDDQDDELPQEHPLGCNIATLRASKSFPALHLDHFHSDTLGTDLMGVGMLNQDNSLTNTPVYFKEDDEDPAKYVVDNIYNAWIVLADELCGKPLAVLNKKKADWSSLNDIQSFNVLDNSGDEVLISPLQKGDFILFETLGVMHGALPIYDGDDNRCPTKCRQSIEFRFVTLKLEPVEVQQQQQQVVNDVNDQVIEEQEPIDDLTDKSTVSKGKKNEDEVDQTTQTVDEFAQLHTAYKNANQHLSHIPLEATEIDSTS